MFPCFFRPSEIFPGISSVPEFYFFLIIKCPTGLPLDISKEILSEIISEIPPEVLLGFPPRTLPRIQSGIPVRIISYI